MVAIQARLPVATPVPRPEPVLHLPASSTLLIIVERKEDWSDYLPSESIVTAQEYLEDRRLTAGGGRIQVLNLCRNYRYLATATIARCWRRRAVIASSPRLRTLSELNRKALYGLLLEDLDALVDQAWPSTHWAPPRASPSTSILAAPSFAPLQALARQLFDAFPCPILQVELRHSRHWHIAGIKSGALHRLQDAQQYAFADALDAFNRRIWRQPASRRQARYDLAILHDPEESLPPSNAAALAGFVAAGRDLGWPWS